jgi:hypothetical protein
MPTVTLATKVYHESQLRKIDEILRGNLHELNIKITPAEANPRGWLQLQVSGEDEKIALNYLTREFGSCTTSLEGIKKYSDLKGYIKAADKESLSVDVGISSPETLHVRIPLPQLQAQLADGRKVALTKIVNLYGLIANLPLEVKVLSASIDRFEAELGEKQVNRYASWAESMLDRLIIVGATRDEVESVLKNAHLNRDAANIEDLGLLEHSVVCKLGTDAVGLIPKVGYRLRHAAFAVFSPKRIAEFLGHNDSQLGQ